MIELSYEREDVYNINFKKQELPEPKLAKTKRALVLTHLFLYRNMNITDFSEKHEIDTEAIKEYIQLLIQSLTIRGYYRKDKFIVASIYKFPNVNPGRLTSIRKSLLGLFAYVEKINLKEIANIAEIKYEVLLENIRYFINRGLVIGSIKNRELILNLVWKPQEKVTISTEDTFIVIQLGDVNGNNKNRCFVLAIDFTKITFSKGVSRFARQVDGVLSQYYVRKYKTLTSGFRDYDRYPDAFAQSYFGDEEVGFNFVQDIDISGKVDNLGRPLSELFLSIIKVDTDS